MGMKEYYAELERQQSELNIPAPPPPEPKKSLLGEMGTQLQAGLYGDLPSMLGAAGQAIAPVRSSFYEAAKEFRQAGEAIQKLPELQPTAKSDELLAGTLAKGARGIGGIAPALAVGALTGPVGAAGAGGALFGGSTYQETKEKTLSKYGLDDAYAAAHPEDPRVQEAKQAGALTGAIQGAGEAAMNYVGGKLVKGFVPGFKKTAEEVMQGYVNPKTLTNFLKAWGTGALAEGATEVIQDEGQAAVERAYGIPDTPGFGEQALESFQGGVGMAALLGPLGVKGHRSASAEKLKLVRDLEDPAANPQDRLGAATTIATDIAKTDPKAAMTFLDRAFDAIGNADITGSEPYALKMDASVFKPLSEVHKEIAEKAKEQPVVQQEELFPQATSEQDLINQAWEQEAQRVAQYQEDDRAIAAGEIAPGRPTFRGLAQTPGARPATDNAGRLIEEERAGFAPSMYSAFGDMRTQSDEMRQGPESILRGQASQPVATAPRAQQIIDEVRGQAQAQQQIISKQPWEMTTAEVIAEAEKQLSGKTFGYNKVGNTYKPAPFVPNEDTRANILYAHKNSIKKAIGEGKSVPAEVLAEYPDLQAPSAVRQDLINRRKLVKSILDDHASGKEVLTQDEVEGYESEYEDLLQEIMMTQERFARPEVPATQGAKATQVSQWLGATPAGVQVLDDFTTLYPDNPKNQSAQAVVLNGKVYINASKINSSQQARDILFDHELRHIGLSKMFGGAENLAKEMEKAFKGNEEEIVAFALSRGYTRSVAEATEEYIVSKAKEAKDMTLLNKVIAAIRTWARKNGFGSLGYSNSEMLKMIDESGVIMGVEEPAKISYTRYAKRNGKFVEETVEDAPTQEAVQQLAEQKKTLEDLMECVV